MMYEDNLFKVLLAPRISEKSSLSAEKSNTIVFKVMANAKKKVIKNAVQVLFNVEVSAVNTLLIKGKKKRKGNQVSRNKNWKKAYITLKKGHNVDLLGSTD
ncbi:50S ribosomal protein L23 [Buchnera aphidicola]|uniref:50S ribosomal protein L23 n=1 Tax=Buchnera aphidicola TaxID=9 RepID=UPI003463BA05